MVAGVTTLQRGTTRPNTEEATCIVRDGPMGGKREGAGAEEKNVADGSGERGKSSQGRPSPGERKKGGCQKRERTRDGVIPGLGSDPESKYGSFYLQATATQVIG